MGKFIDLTDKCFGRLTVIKKAGQSKRGVSLWECQCSCGNIKIFYGTNLTRGTTKSCGCLARELSRKRMKKQATIHGQSNTPVYEAWRHILQRCFNKNDKNYHNYGGRGITVCDSWKSSFEDFYKDMGEKPSSKHTVERIDNNKGYFPGNCEWATYVVQSHNRRLCKKNKTGTSGVWWNAKRGGYEVCIRVENKKIYLGRFEKIEDAILTRKNAELKYWETAAFSVGTIKNGLVDYKAAKI